MIRRSLAAAAAIAALPPAALAKGLSRLSNLAAGESGWINLDNAPPWPTSGSTSNAGELVSSESALSLSAVFDAVRKTAQLIGTTPLQQLEKDAEGNPVEVDDDLQQILTGKPAPHLTAEQFWEGQVAQMLLRGNGYSERLFIGRRLVGLRPLFNVTPIRLASGGFKYRNIDRGKIEELPADKVFHLRGFGAGDGLGMSVVKYGTNSIGAALAADKTAGKVFSNSMMLAGVLSTEQTLNETQREQTQGILDQYVGSSKAGKTMVLEAGMNFAQMQLEPEDAQLLQTRRFSVEDVCRWFGIPPIVIGHAVEGQTMFGAGVEHIMLYWQRLGINPLYRGIEAQIREDLISPERRRGSRKRYFRFDRQAMLTMDSKALADFLLKLRMGGYASADEGRTRYLNLPARGGAADELIVSQSMTPAELLGKDTET